MLGKSLHEDGLCHLEAVVEVDEVLNLLVLLGKLLGGHHGQGAVEVVHGLNQILGEALDGEFSSSLDLALRAVLKIAEISHCAEALVL